MNAITPKRAAVFVSVFTFIAVGITGAWESWKQKLMPESFPSPSQTRSKSSSHGPIYLTHSWMDSHIHVDPSQTVTWNILGEKHLVYWVRDKDRPSQTLQSFRAKQTLTPKDISNYQWRVEGRSDWPVELTCTIR